MGYMPKVSIVLPTYNGAKYIKDSIESVLRQSYKDWELIIVNDCSTDNTAQIIEEYQKKDVRIKIISNTTNQKLPQALNIGFASATGEYYTWTSDDNMYKEQALSFMVDYLDNHVEIDLVSCGFEFISHDGEFENVYAPNRNFLQLVLDGCNVGACFMYRRQIAEVVGQYDTEMFCAEDYDYWCRIALNGNIAYCKENLYSYRRNPSSLATTKGDVVVQKSLEIKSRYIVPLMTKAKLSTKKQAKALYKLYKATNDKQWLKRAFEVSSLWTLFYKQYFFSKIKTKTATIFKIFGIRIKIKNKLYKMYKKMNDTSFYKHAIFPKSVLIVEPNPYHAEILPGFVKYFQELGFCVDLFLRHENNNPFEKYVKTPPTIFRGQIEHFKKLLSLEKIKEYDYVFISTSAYWEDKVHFNSFINYLGFEPCGKKGLLLVEHNLIPYMEKYDEKKYLRAGRLFTLSGFGNTPMLNPHYFGDFMLSDKKNDITQFIVVGSINKSCKNHNLLFDAVRILLNKGYRYFKVTVIGDGYIQFPEHIARYIDGGYMPHHIEFKGRLGCIDTYDYMQHSDFFLPLLDLEVDGHKRYLTGTTTGSRQLILGFLKPCLINEEFGKVYDFDEGNSILYANNDLATAMEKAIVMNQNAYKLMHNNLKVLAENIYQRSLENLKNSLEGIVRR